MAEMQALSSEELDTINGWVDRLGPIVRLHQPCMVRLFA